MEDKYVSLGILIAQTVSSMIFAPARSISKSLKGDSI
jgi:hypothetical protein